MRVLAGRNRAGACLIVLCVGTGLFGLFFFLTLFIQTVLGYSAIRAGLACLPFAAGVVIASGLASQPAARTGPRPLTGAGAAMAAGAMFWFSRLTGQAGYASHLPGPQLASSSGPGLVFVPLALAARHNVAGRDSGVASSLLNTARQAGRAIGLALLGTVAWTAVADSVRTQVAHAAAAAKAGQPAPEPGAPRPASICDHALTAGFPARSWLPRASGCSPCSSRSPPSGPAARTWPAPRPNRHSRHRSPPHRSPGLCSGMRTEPPSPRRPARAGSASRHVTTTRDKSPGTNPAQHLQPAAALPRAPRGSHRRLLRPHRHQQHRPQPHPPGIPPTGPEGRRSARRASAARHGHTGRAPGDLVAEPLPGEDLRGDLLPLAGAGARPDGGAHGLEDGILAFAAAYVRRRRCPGRAAPRHRAPRVRRPGSPAGERRSRSRG
jgi:hypothetical protein